MLLERFHNGFPKSVFQVYSSTQSLLRCNILYLLMTWDKICTCLCEILRNLKTHQMIRFFCRLFFVREMLVELIWGMIRFGWHICLFSIWFFMQPTCNYILVLKKSLKSLDWSNKLLEFVCFTIVHMYCMYPSCADYAREINCIWGLYLHKMTYSTLISWGPFF